MSIGVLLEVAIGILFVWIMLAAITSQIQEWISQWSAWRPKLLEESIKGILANDKLAADFYKHPLIVSLHSKTRKGALRMPSQIPNRQFTSVVFDMVFDAGSEKSVANDMKTTLQNLRNNIKSLRNGDANDGYGNLAKALDAILVDVSMDVEKVDASIAEARKRVEAWYGDAMERMSGSYKRRMQLWSIIVGIILAFALNADSLAIANTLWREPLVRAALVAQAEQLKLEDLGIGEGSQPSSPQQGAAQNIAQLQSLPVPLGWTKANMPADAGGWGLKIGGILLSGMAAAQGAPFWFDIMRKILSFRSGGGGGTGEPAKKEEGK